jgi:hypothetical protein
MRDALFWGFLNFLDRLPRYGRSYSVPAGMSFPEWRESKERHVEWHWRSWGMWGRSLMRLLGQERAYWDHLDWALSADGDDEDEEDENAREAVSPEGGSEGSQGGQGDRA